MSTARRLHYTYAQYLEIERMSSVKHEFLDGDIYAMAGGTPEHAILRDRLALLIGSRLGEGCRTSSPALKINILASGLSTYPDGAVICGPLQRDPRDENAITNPTLVFEVTSPSTEDYDRGDKLSHYKQIASVQTILLASHAAPRLTVITRVKGGWETVDYRPSERITLTSPPLELSVDELYSVLSGL